MGVDRNGRFAALTNYTEPTPDPLPQTTRGDLITQFLVGEQSAKAYMASLASTADDYRGFNLLLMDEEASLFQQPAQAASAPGTRHLCAIESLS